MIGDNNRPYSAGTTVDILQFNQPYAFPSTSADDVFDLKYITYLRSCVRCLLRMTSVYSCNHSSWYCSSAFGKLHANVCEEVMQPTAYYLIRDFDFTNTALVNNKLADANLAAVSGQPLILMCCHCYGCRRWCT